MKSIKLQISIVSLALAGLLQCSFVWAGAAAAPSTGNPGGPTGAGATNGTVGNGALTDGVSPNGATPGPTGNPSPTTPVRPIVNPPTQPATSTGQDVREPSNPARKR